MQTPTLSFLERLTEAGIAIHNPDFLVAPLSGRMVRRPVSDGEVLAGVLHFPGDAVIRESDMYLLIIHSDEIRLVREPVSGAPDIDASNHTAGCWANNPVWARSRSSCVIPVRFIQAFPETNGWAMMAVSSYSQPTDAPDHSWFDVNSGRLSPICPPADAVGLAAGQLLSSLAVWPDQDGQAHTLSQLPSRWRPVYLRYHQLLADVGDGVRTAADVMSAIKADKDLHAILPFGSIDHDYCNFLAAKRAIEGLDADRPFLAAERDGRGVKATKIFVSATMKRV